MNKSDDPRTYLVLIRLAAEDENRHCALGLPALDRRESVRIEVVEYVSLSMKTNRQSKERNHEYLVTLTKFQS